MSVVICAYTLDRWEDLTTAVESAANQQPPPLEVILIIDHNPQLLARASAQLTRATVIPSDRQRGLSGARNTGTAAATGDVVAFLDDDAVASDGWLAVLVEHFTEPSVLAVGGAAHPRWPGKRPSMYPSPSGTAHGELDWVVGCSYRGQPETVRDVRNVLGCNMAFRRRLVEEVGGFREDLGRTAGRPLGCEETELCIRLTLHHPGGRVVLDPSCRVTHRVGPERLRWRYLVSRCFAEGESKSAVARSVGRQSGLSTERGYVARVLPAAVRRELMDAFRGRPRGFVSTAALIAAPMVAAAGYAVESLRTGRRTPATEPLSQGTRA